MPAHDEAAGIGRTLKAFDDARLPIRALLGARRRGQLHRRHRGRRARRAAGPSTSATAPDDPGKGPALNWLFDRLVASGEPFDAIVIVDADTTVDPGFLRAMDQQVRAGSRPRRATTRFETPTSRPSSSFRFAALACRHHLRPLGRCRLGGSSGLYGNGMMFTRSLFAGRRWTGHLVEDAELQNELLLDGHLVTYAPDAVVWAEMPHTLSQATSQNQRWERGRIEMAQRYVPELLAGLPAARGRRFARIDAVLDHLGAAALGAGGAAARRRRSCTRSARSRVTARHESSLVRRRRRARGPRRAHVFAGLASVGAPAVRYKALLSAPKAGRRGRSRSGPRRCDRTKRSTGPAPQRNVETACE